MLERKSLGLLRRADLAVWVVGAVGLISLGLLAYSDSTWRKSVRRYVPLLDNIMQVRVSLATAHLWLEEMITGDQTIRPEQVWALFDQAGRALERCRTGASSIANMPGLPLVEPEILDQVGRLQVSTDRLGSLARERWTHGDVSGIGSTADQEFDAAYGDAERRAEIIDQLAHEHVARMTAHQHNVHAITLAAWVAVLAGSCTVLVLMGRKRRLAEQRLQRLNEELETRVARRTVQLEVANKELEAFAHSVSHDLRAPLRGIDGFSQVLLEDYADRLDDQGKDSLVRVRRGCQQMGRLIDGLLRLSRLTRVEMRHEMVDLSGLARTIAGQLQENDPHRPVELSIAPGLEVEGDAELLRVALENLLGNAWKFTGKQERARIEFGVTRVAGERAYFVRDDGSGFEMQYADKLFGPFQRLHAATEFSGTGIGLATVQRIIHRHGGRIWAEGAVEQGATFYFTLPSGAEISVPEPEGGRKNGVKETDLACGR